MYSGDVVFACDAKAQSSGDEKETREAKASDKAAADAAAADLLVAADRYGVSDVVDICASKLASSIAVDNVISRVLLGDKLALPALTEACSEFFSSNLRSTRLVMQDVAEQPAFAELDAQQMRTLWRAVTGNNNASTSGARDLRAGAVSRARDLRAGAS